MYFLKDSIFFIKNIKDHACGKDYWGKYNLAFYGNSTTLDLFKWDRALYTNKSVGNQSLNEMFTSATLNNGTKTGYGFGWSLDTSADFGKVDSHYGGWPGYVSYIERDITNDKTVIILTNHYNKINYVQTLQNSLYNKPSPKLVIRKEIYLPVDSLRKFEGVYIRDSDEITIYIKDGLLYYQQAGRNALLLTPESERSFFVKMFNDTQIQFDKNKEGAIVYFILSEGRAIKSSKEKVELHTTSAFAIAAARS